VNTRSPGVGQIHTTSQFSSPPGGGHAWCGFFKVALPLPAAAVVVYVTSSAAKWIYG